MSQPVSLGIYVGRFCPPHEGHCRVIQYLLNEVGMPNSLLVIGSSNHAISYRHLFPLRDRMEIIDQIFPGINRVGIPDHDTDEAWLNDLWALIECWRHGREKPEDRKVTFFGGCEEDILFFIKGGYQYKILNRFDGTGPKLSATEIRDALVHGRTLDGLVPQKVQNLVCSQFAKRWTEVKNH